MRWLLPVIIFCLIYIEVSIFVAVVNRIGVFSSLLAIFITCIIGLALVKHMGIKNAQQIKQKLEIGQTPTPEITKNISLLVAAILFIIPGFFTSICGALLLLPMVQNLLVKRFVKYAKFNRKSTYTHHQGEPRQTITIEGSYTEKQTPTENDENINK